GLWWAYLRSGYADAFGVRQESLLTCGVEPLAWPKALAGLRALGLVELAGEQVHVRRLGWRVVEAAEGVSMAVPGTRRLVVEGRFTPGPVPVAWLAHLARVPHATARAVLLALAVWRRYAMHSYCDDSFILSDPAAKMFGLDRYAKRRALLQLEEAALVHVQ